MTPLLSICVITCDEEVELARCFDALDRLRARVACECIVMVDAKSSDGSEKLARERADRIEIRAYRDDVDQKSACTALARGTWVLIVDPDEVVPKALVDEIGGVVGQPGAAAGYEVSRLTYHLGRWIRHGDFYPDWTLRLFRRADARWAGASPHGRIEVSGAVARLAHPLLHYSYRDLADQVERIQLFSTQAAASMHRAGRRARWSDWVLRPPARFARAYLLKRGFLDGFPGFAIAWATAFHVFLKYAKLWELERRERGRR